MRIKVDLRAKIDIVLSAQGRKPGTNYPDLEPGTRFLEPVRVPRGSGYKSLITHFYFVIKTAVQYIKGEVFFTNASPGSIN